MSVIAAPWRRMASRPGRGGTPDCRRGMAPARGTLLAVENVRREQDGWDVSVVDPVVTEAVGFAADVAGLMLDGDAAGGAILGNGAAQRVDQGWSVLVAV